MWNVNDYRGSETQSSQVVLIGTLWNVNVVDKEARKKSVMVLIGTLWNVNIGVTILKGLLETSFNRYIVECKFIEGTSQTLKEHCFNRYIVECK